MTCLDTWLFWKSLELFLLHGIISHPQMEKLQIKTPFMPLEDKCPKEVLPRPTLDGTKFITQLTQIIVSSLNSHYWLQACLVCTNVHLDSSFFPSFFFFFLLHLEACGILVPWPGIEPVPPAVEAQSSNHWTTREFPAAPSFYLQWPHRGEIGIGL